MEQGGNEIRYGVEHHGLKNVGRVYWTANTPILYEQIVRRREGVIAHLGPIVVRTGHFTGRSPDDKLIVREKSSEDKIWWGPVNTPMNPAKFDTLYFRLLAYLQGPGAALMSFGHDPLLEVRRDIQLPI